MDTTALFVGFVIQALGMLAAYIEFKRKFTQQVKNDHIARLKEEKESLLLHAQADEQQAQSYNKVFNLLVERDEVILLMRQEIAELRVSHTNSEAELSAMKESLAIERQRSDRLEREMRLQEERANGLEQQLKREQELRLSIQHERDDLKRDVAELKSYINRVKETGNVGTSGAI